MPEEKVSFPSIKDVSRQAWEKLSKKTISFGHQSVGNNIINGIKDLMEEKPQIKLKIVETFEQADFNGGLFAHFKVDFHIRFTLSNRLYGLIYRADANTDSSGDSDSVSFRVCRCGKHDIGKGHGSGSHEKIHDNIELNFL